MPPTEAIVPVPFDSNLRRLEGKKGLVIGIANENSIAWGCARVPSARSAPSSPLPT
jgi:hypothetical protein